MSFIFPPLPHEAEPLKNNRIYGILKKLQISEIAGIRPIKTFIGLLLGLAATAAWGSFYVAGRWLFGEEGDKLNPYLFIFLRFSLATLALSVLLFGTAAVILLRKGKKRF